jgi:hypothetical protein
MKCFGLRYIGNGNLDNPKELKRATHGRPFENGKVNKATKLTGDL